MVMAIVTAITLINSLQLGIALSIIGLATIAISVTGILLEDDIRNAARQPH